MKRANLALAFLFWAVAAPLQSQGTAARSLISAGTSADLARRVFDGSLHAVLPVLVPGAAGRPAQLLPPAPAPASAPPVVPAGPFSPRKFSGGFVGLYPESEFDLTTGRRCAGCNAPLEGTWYFADEVIAVPKSGIKSLVWIGSSEMLEGVVLSKDGRSIRLKDGSVLPFSLVPKIASNRSFYDESTSAYFQDRPLRIRGEYVVKDGARSFVGRTIWPEDQRIDFAGLKKIDAKTKTDIDALVTTDDGGAKGAYSAAVLWERGQDRSWGGKAVMGFMLNGAQGDDDEAHAGHFSMFTGRMGPNGEMADWMFDNFYDMDQQSEKGIIASMVPMDKYMADVNSGQSYYRGTHMIVMVLKDEGLALKIQEQFRDRYAKYYSHEAKYDRTFNPCTALVIDILRADGWNYPTEGPSPGLSRAGLSLLSAVGSWDPRVGKAMRDIMSQDKSRLYPRAGFASISGDLLSLTGAGAVPARSLTPFEKTLQQDTEALLFVRLPQIPSSRRFGRYSVASTEEYFRRVPLRHSKWETVPGVPRPFPPPHDF